MGRLPPCHSYAEGFGSLNYDPSIFRDINTVERAKWVILNPDGVHTVDERWEIETCWLMDIISAWMPQRDATCLDYGGGIGRLAKPLIDERGWSVIGADISPAMRLMAVNYVKSEQFMACDPGALTQLSRFGLAVDFAVIAWTLQHCEKPAEDIARIKRLVRPGGRVFVLNAGVRFVPTSTDKSFAWHDDGVDVWTMLSEVFVPLRVEPVDIKIVPVPPAAWGVFERCKD